jgi:hypothetical protein
MPNWCSHKVSIEGPSEEVMALVVLLSGNDGPFDFNKLIPRPATEDANWYKWNTHHWGTKWNACNQGPAPAGGNPLEALAATGDTEVRREVEYTFDTAWSPPEPIMAKLVADHPQLTITWWGIEEQPCWGCFLVFRGGEVVEGSDQCEPEKIFALSEWHGRMKLADTYIEEEQ